LPNFAQLTGFAQQVLITEIVTFKNRAKQTTIQDSAAQKWFKILA